MAGNGEKTEQATPRRLDKARDEGNFAVSAEILAAFYLIAALALWSRQGESVWSSLVLQMRRGLQLAFRTDISVYAAARESLMSGLPLVGILALGGGFLVAAAVSLQLFQTGFRMAPSKLAPDLARLNPWPRLKAMPEQNRQQAVRAILLLPVLGLLVDSLVRRHWFELLAIPGMEYSQAAAKLLELARSTLWQAAAVLVVLALLDFAQRRRRYSRDLMMSRQEIRDESKDAEGNVQAKARVRRLMRDLTRRRMMSAVPKATAVVVNPEHYAVAIYYEPGESVAPQVVAKGKNYLAARIRAVARANGVPIVENPPLARSLYRSAAVGQEIPAALYRAVAEVLAYVYRLTHGGFPRGR